MSYPLADPDKMRSTVAACRTVPPEYIVSRSSLQFGSETCPDNSAGLCSDGCSGSCK